MKIHKLHKDSKDRILEDIQKELGEIETLFVVAENKDGTLSWWTTGTEELFWHVGALDYLKDRLKLRDGKKI